MKVYFYDRYLLHILFPAFIRMPETFLSPETKVYIMHEHGDPLKREQELQFQYRNFLLVLPSAGLADIAIKNLDEAYMFISNKYRIKPNSVILRKLKKLSEEEQREFFKTSVALGKWYKEIFTRKEKVYRMFEAISKGQISALSTWFKLTENYAPAMLFSSMLTFFLRMDKILEERDMLSDWMLRVLSKAKRQKFNLKQAFMSLSVRGLDFRIKVLGFLLSLRE